MSSKLTTLTVAAATALAAVSCEQRIDDVSNVSCIERLKLPGYPPVLQAARIPLTADVSIVLGADGSVQSRKFGPLNGPNGKDLSSAVVPLLDEAINASRFRKDCGGKTVDLVFRFEIRLDTRSTAWFEYPNRFQIDAESPLVESSNLGASR